MAKNEISTRRLAISKAQAQMVAIVGVAAFIAVFSLVASNAVWGQNKYRSKVIAKKETAKRQLVSNLSAYDSLEKSYKDFDGNSSNIIGGFKTGTGLKDGSNSRLILDALPSSYDFPALTSSIEKILTDRKLKVTAITGIDDQVAQEQNFTSATPKPVEMPFSFTIEKANYTAVQDVVAALGQSIRPIQIDSMSVGGGGGDMTLNVTAHTFYQPGRSLQIKSEAVK